MRATPLETLGFVLADPAASGAEVPGFRFLRRFFFFIGASPIAAAPSAAAPGRAGTPVAGRAPSARAGRPPSARAGRAPSDRPPSERPPAEATDEPSGAAASFDSLFSRKRSCLASLLPRSAANFSLTVRELMPRIASGVCTLPAAGHLSGSMSSSTGTAISRPYTPKSSPGGGSSRTSTSCTRIFESITMPGPSAVPTRVLFLGRRLRRSS